MESIPEVTKTADVLFVAIGYPELVKRSWVKEGCIVVDIGINARPTNEKDNIEDLAKRMLANGSPPTSAVEIVGDALTTRRCLRWRPTSPRSRVGRVR